MSGVIDKTQVIIIGAGMAGLSAAAALKRGQVNTVLLEARDRAGGRIFTDRSLGVALDMGAASIHGASGNPIVDLAIAAGVEKTAAEFDSFLCYAPGGAAFSNADVEAGEQAFTALHHSIKEQAVNGEAMAQAIKRIAPRALEDPLMRLNAATEFEFDVGGPIGDLSVSEFDEDEVFPGPDLYVTGGYDRIVDHMAAELDVRFGQIVTHVSVQDDKVVIDTTAGKFAADICICTLPIGVLKSGDVGFTPELPKDIVDAIRCIGAGHANKIALKFDQVFWDADVQHIGYAGSELGRFPYFLNLHATCPGAQSLMTFAVGNYGREIQKRTNAEIEADVMAALTDIYGTAAVAPVEMRVSRWGQDPYSQCSYSYASAASNSADFEAFEAIVDDRLLFAGEHTNVDYRGTVHGAFLSGQRAAGHALNRL